MRILFLVCLVVGACHSGCAHTKRYSSSECTTWKADPVTHDFVCADKK